MILNITPTAAGYYLRLVAGRTPVELFLVLAGVLFTCYLAAFGLLLGTPSQSAVDNPPDTATKSPARGRLLPRRLE